MKHFYPRIETIKLIVIVLVVFVHANVTYSGLGSWYYTETKFEQLDTPHMAVSALFGTTTQAWFMGLLFMISGFFAERSISKTDFWPWFKKRLVRLGLPLLFFMVILSPLTRWFGSLASGHDYDFLGFVAHYFSHDLAGGSGPLWFVLALLIFAPLHFGLSRTLKLPSKPTFLTPLGLLALIVVCALLTFCNRLLWSIDYQFLNLQFPFFVSYIILYSLGAHFGRRDYEPSQLKAFKPLFVTTIIVAIPLFVFMSAIGGAFEGKGDTYKGGLTFQSAMYSGWESLLALGISVGAFTFAVQKKLDSPLEKQSFLSKHSFGIFVFHAPILTLTSYFLKNLSLDPLVKIPLSVVITLVACALVIWPMSKIKVLNVLVR